MDKCPKCHAPARCGPPDGDFRYVPPFDYRAELAAANKAIVALAWELEKFIAKVDRGEARSVESYGEMKEALKTHAPAIEKARGG